MDNNRFQRDYWNSVSACYKGTIISPFANERSEKDFIAAVKKLLNTRRWNNKDGSDSAWFLDDGCGNGYLLPFLTMNQFGQDTRKTNVIGIDFSPKMVRSATEHCHNKNVSARFAIADYSNLPFPCDSFDVIATINSMLAVDRAVRFAAFAEMHRVLKKCGVMVGLFPSNENHIEYAYRIKEGFISENCDEKTSLEMVYNELSERRYDPIGGFIDMENGDLRIKLYSRIELEDILDFHSFNILSIGKFHYHESVAEQFGLTQGRGIFDWLVLAEKN